MDTFYYLASGGSTVEDFAKDVYIRSNLTNHTRETIHKLLDEVYGGDQEEVINTGQKDVKIITEISSSAVNELVSCFEACFLHGLKGKPFLNRVLGKTGKNSQDIFMDFWSVILILSHNQVSESLAQLNNIKTDIGKCRAWLRLTFNDGLLASYIEALVNDSSLLHGFYRPSAYLRDNENVNELRKLMDSLRSCTFQLNYDYQLLNNWSIETLKLIGINLRDTSPVVAAVDALSTIGDRRRRRDAAKIKLSKNSQNRSDQPDLNSKETKAVENSNSTVKSSSENSTPQLSATSITMKPESSSPIPVGNSKMTPNIATMLQKTHLSSENLETSSLSSDRDENFSQLPSLSQLSDSITIGSDESRGNRIDNENASEENTYENLLYSVSTNVILSSTPDMREFVLPKPRNNSPNSEEGSSLIDKDCEKEIFNRKNLTHHGDKTNRVNNDFEIIPKTLVLSNQEPENQEFLLQMTKVANQVGLDEQDYKCYSCGRPVGMIYGKYKVCEFDGFNYCCECHTDEKALIPARVINNWDFKKYSVANRNKKRLQLVENEPLIDIKVSAPVLYRVVKEMQEILNLRTQLFYLHAYLFTCKEQVALGLRRILWPKDHLSEHIHLYSTTDLVNIQSNGNLQSLLKKAIQYARKHVLSCVLCSQRGFICEICRSPQIIYPFDTDTTFRCDNCKAVFHKKCFVGDDGKKSCPRCLRIKRRERMFELKF